MQDIFRSQFRLPNELAEKLRNEAERSNRSLNAEIVARLEATFSRETPSEKTKELLKLAFQAGLEAKENPAAIAKIVELLGR